MKSYRDQARGRLAKAQFDDVDTFLSGLTAKIQKDVEKTDLQSSNHCSKI